MFLQTSNTNINKDHKPVVTISSDIIDNNNNNTNNTNHNSFTMSIDQLVEEWDDLMEKNEYEGAQLFLQQPVMDLFAMVVCSNVLVICVCVVLGKCTVKACGCVYVCACVSM